MTSEVRMVLLTLRSAIGPEVVVGAAGQVGFTACAFDVIDITLFDALFCECSGFVRR